MNALARTLSAFALVLVLAQIAGASQAQTTGPDSSTQSTSSTTVTQTPAPQPITSMIPEQITSAHTVFLTNMGGDPNFPIDISQAYSDIYAKLQSWGHYQLVGSPAQADLVFQLRDVAPISDVSGSSGSVSTTTSPAFQITILDPRLNIPLYTLTSPVVVVGNRKTRERWVGIAETNLVSRIKVLTSQPLSATESADLLTVPKYHTGTLAWIVGGSIIGLGIAGGFILHHEFENSLADQKASQDAFCNANHIPLSECAGG